VVRFSLDQSTGNKQVGGHMFRVLIILGALVALFIGCSESSNPGPEPLVLTVAIPTLTVESGAEVMVPITVTEFKNVAGIELHIAFEQDYMTYSDIEADCLPGAILNEANGFIHVIWADIANTLSLTDGDSLVCLHFAGLNGTSHLTFHESSCIVDVNGDPIANQQHIDGAVTYVP